MTEAELRNAIRRLGLAGRPVCVHASLRSFGRVEGSARSVVDAFLAEGCTLLVPTFSGAAFEVWPDPPDVIERNGWPPANPASPRPVPTRIFTPDINDIDADMGAIPAAVLATPGRVRGAHPLDSFAAIGPLAHALVAGQDAHHPHAPLEALAAAGGAVVLMGVGLERMTLLHLAEHRAGRAMFVRWAAGPAGEIVRVRVGGCSEGFPRLAAVLAPIGVEAMVGASRWRIFPAAEALDAAADAIRADPAITHCGDPACERCNDAVRGGPLLDG